MMTMALLTSRRFSWSVFFVVLTLQVPVSVVSSVNGSWGSWQVGKCSVTCGNGWRQRVRQCDSPAPSDGGLPCKGPSIQHDSCRMPPCEVERLAPGKSEWSEWSECSGTCGLGTRRRTRICQTPHCNEVDSQVESCTNNAAIPPCPTDGGWSAWVTFLRCPKSTEKICEYPVNTFQQVQMRFCSAPHPQYGGKDCEGPEFNYTSCNKLVTCPKVPQWSAWKSTGRCTVTCGVGFEKKTRVCLVIGNRSEPPKCPGSPTKMEPCTMPPCRVDGGWSAWLETRSCVKALPGDPCPPENDMRTLERRCTNPPPANGGLPCQGESLRAEKCPTINNCGWPASSTTLAPALWSEWQLLGPCSVTCGDGLQQRKRTCLSRTRECDGPGESMVQCRMAPCPTSTITTTTTVTSTQATSTSTVFSSIDSESVLTVTLATGSSGYSIEDTSSDSAYSSWSEWSHCDNKCQQTRSRKCKQEASGCIRDLAQTRDCIRQGKEVCWKPDSDGLNHSLKHLSCIDTAVYANFLILLAIYVVLI